MKAGALVWETSAGERAQRLFMAPEIPVVAADDTAAASPAAASLRFVNTQPLFW
jgi:hypothetical protein